ncbi:MAG: shikimate kinase, partial [Acidimicrobiia bacterium]|nr:shikimate kinase [Acidimicrobiia bacterium]
MGTLWLVGMMGAGKTTVGWLVADRVGRPFVDLDDDVVAAAGSSIPDIFAMQGETAFRALEHAALMERAGSEAVVACGGGVVIDERNVARMRAEGVVVWLDAPAEVLRGRVGDGEGRP